MTGNYSILAHHPNKGPAVAVAGGFGEHGGVSGRLSMAGFRWHPPISANADHRCCTMQSEQQQVCKADVFL